VTSESRLAVDEYAAPADGVDADSDSDDVGDMERESGTA
jgi:hypothetical protein